MLFLLFDFGFLVYHYIGVHQFKKDGKIIEGTISKILQSGSKGYTYHIQFEESDNYRLIEASSTHSLGEVGSTVKLYSMNEGKDVGLIQDIYSTNATILWSVFTLLAIALIVIVLVPDIVSGLIEE